MTAIELKNCTLSSDEEQNLVTHGPSLESLTLKTCVISGSEFLVSEDSISMIQERILLKHITDINTDPNVGEIFRIEKIGFDRHNTIHH